VANYYRIGPQRTADGAATVLSVEGELDINARDDLREAILEALATGGAVVDLAGVSFLDSEALGALIDGYNVAQRRRVSYRVVHATGLVERVLTVSGALELFGS
jgi:anti-anti-sigma factor